MFHSKPGSDINCNKRTFPWVRLIKLDVKAGIQWTDFHSIENRTRSAIGRKEAGGGQSGRVSKGVKIRCHLMAMESMSPIVVVKYDTKIKSMNKTGEGTRSERCADFDCRRCGWSRRARSFWRGACAAPSSCRSRRTTNTITACDVTSPPSSSWRCSCSPYRPSLPRPAFKSSTRAALNTINPARLVRHFLGGMLQNSIHSCRRPPWRIDAVFRLE